MRAGIYVRISRDIAGQGLGVSRQEEDCRSLADKLGWEVAEVYVDNDISATSGKPRPAYRRLLVDLQAGAIAGIIAWHPDRLYRRAVDLGELVEVCKSTEAKVATVNAGEVDLTSPTGLLVADMLAAIAMYEVRHKSERWTRSWRQGRERGEVARTGRRMFGYTRGGQIVPTEAELARQAAADLLAGTTIAAIIRVWGKRGILTTEGNPWRDTTLREYLANPRIAGWSTLNGEIVAEGQWEPILDKETWETLRALFASRRQTHTPRVSILIGLIHCGACGHRMITGSQRGRRTYRCPNRPRMPGCGRISGDAAKIEEIVEAYARVRLDDPRVRDRLAQMGATASSDAGEILALERRLAELEAQLDQPGVPVATIMRAMDRTRDRMVELQSSLAAAPRALPARGLTWPADVERRARLVGLVVAKVWLDPAPRTGGRFDGERVRIDPR